MGQLLSCVSTGAGHLSLYPLTEPPLSLLLARVPTETHGPQCREGMDWSWSLILRPVGEESVG